ncbi:hypothetical protein CAP50_09940 [Psychrobacter sp. L7]|nr:hypothetical protein BTV99_02155 [Psychrobacter sp. Rd 27.2]PJX21210.1 hypothetical protein CAP50_09940 [Psychrobacter sp. L7]
MIAEPVRLRYVIEWPYLLDTVIHQRRQIDLIMLNGVNSQAVLHIMTTNHSQKKPNQLHYLPKIIR